MITKETINDTLGVIYHPGGKYHISTSNEWKHRDENLRHVRVCENDCSRALAARLLLKLFQGSRQTEGKNRCSIKDKLRLILKVFNDILKRE